MAYFGGVSSMAVLLCIIFTLQTQLATSSKNPNDPAIQLFFKTSDLVVGKKIPVYFPMSEPTKHPHFLSKEEADVIPFSSHELPKILKFFSIPKGSSSAKIMETTIETCEVEPIKGETKFCATSMDSLLDSAKAIFGPDLDIKVTNTKIDRSKDPSYTPILQNYTIAENTQEIQPSKAMACHPMVYPYTVYFCHLQFADHKIYKIPLVGDNGWKIQALGICHMDTSAWDPNHVAFLVLNTKPGKSPICHFFSEQDLVLLPSSVDI